MLNLDKILPNRKSISKIELDKKTVEDIPTKDDSTIKVETIEKKSNSTGVLEVPSDEIDSIEGKVIHSIEQ